MIKNNHEIPEIEEVSDIFNQKILPLYLDFHEKSTEEYKALIIALQQYAIKLLQVVESGNDLVKFVDQQREYNTALLALLASFSNIDSAEQLKLFQDRFQEKVNQELAHVKVMLVVNDAFPAYNINLKENPLLTLKKLTSNANRLIRKLILPFLPSKELTRKRRVLLRSISKQYLFCRFTELAAANTNQLMQSRSRSILSLWKQDSHMDKLFEQGLVSGTLDHKQCSVAVGRLIELCETAVKELDESKDLLLYDTGKLVEILFDELQDALNKADTVELPYRKTGAKVFEKEQEKVLAKDIRLQQEWKNTMRALIDDWAVDVEITLLYYSVYDEFQVLLDKVKRFNKKELSGTLALVRKFIEKTKQNVNSAAKEQNVLIATINNERKSISKQLIDKILTRATEELTFSFASDFELLRHEIAILVDGISSNRAFLSKHSYLQPAFNKELKYISPRELLNFEALPHFNEKITEVEAWAELRLEKARVNLLGIGTVCDFALESALVGLNNSDFDSEEAHKQAAEGLNRALNHLEKAEGILTGIYDGINDELSRAINRFDDEIQKLKNTENILELNIKIARIETIERVKGFRKQTLKTIRENWPKAKERVIKAYKQINLLIHNLKLRMGVAVEKKYLSFELSEFVEQTRESLKNLPFVYQRLYQLNPTDEERFFVNRTNELQTLNESYENWKKDRYITIALIGEKGSGITSLINYFLRKNEIAENVIRHTLSKKIYCIEDYYQFMSELFGMKLPQSNQEIITHLNNLDQNCIVVIENLQHLFLKKVNGFDCMNLFFELLAHTMKKILWVGAYTSHSWRYLDKTIHVSNYFTNEIVLGPMSKEVLEEIIYKRNRLSGYHIVYQPSEENLRQKKFQQMNQSEQQKFLQQQFFGVLRHLSGGNISLAQMYWLRATRLTGEDEISVAPINEFDFQFLKNLSPNELFALQTLIIHDGLALEYFATVMGMPVIAARNLILPMFEKGMLIRPGIKYNINPIIFKPVANYLASRNFVH